LGTHEGVKLHKLTFLRKLECWNIQRVSSLQINIWKNTVLSKI